MSVFRVFHLIVVKKDSLVSVVRKLILMVVKAKHGSERNQTFPFNSSEERQHSECSQWSKTA